MGGSRFTKVGRGPREEMGDFAGWPGCGNLNHAGVDKKSGSKEARSNRAKRYFNFYHLSEENKVQAPWSR